MEDAKEIVRLTGQPVSDELTDVLTRLERGEYISVEEINNTPEMRTAYSFVTHSTPTIQLKDRDEFQANCIDKMLDYGSASIDNEGKTTYNGVVEKEKKLDIIIGLPASGKSSALVDTISQENHSKLIDNDEAKKLIPEFNGGWGAGAVHEESQMICDIAYMISLERGENIVLPKVGSDAEKLLKTYVEPAKKLGYTVNVHFVDLERNKALGRMIGRFVHQGRFLDPKLIDKYNNEIDGNKIDNAYQIIKKSEFITGYSKWSNDVKKGERPIILESHNLTGKYIENARTSEEKEQKNGTERTESNDVNGRDNGESRRSEFESDRIDAGKENIGNDNNGLSENGKTLLSAESVITFQVSQKLMGEPYTMDSGSTLIRIKIPNEDRNDKSPWASFVVSANDVKRTDDGKATVTLSASGTHKIYKPNKVGVDQSGKGIYVNDKTTVSNMDIKKKMDSLSLSKVNVKDMILVNKASMKQKKDQNLDKTKPDKSKDTVL